MPEVSVKTIKGFNNDGVYAKRGSTITVDEQRARDLLRNGLIEEYDMKKAEEPENKKAPDPANKGGKGAATKPKE
jgi:hypothetical protein